MEKSLYATEQNYHWTCGDQWNKKCSVAAWIGKAGREMITWNPDFTGISCMFSESIVPVSHVKWKSL